LLLAVTPFLGLLAALAFLQAATAAKRQATKPPDLLLRLHDLPPGYLNVELQEDQGEQTLCSRLHHSHDDSKALAKLVDRFHPKGCVGAYYRVFTVPGQPPEPLLAGTGALEMSSDRAADAAWSVVPQLLGELFHDRPPQEAAAPAKVGSATKLFHAPQPRIYPFLRKVAPTASFLAWRSRNTLAVVMAVGQSFAEDDQAAVELAQRQQVHIRVPTRYTRAERFDGEVSLDDPAIDVPVYWLGRNFRPGGGLPDNRLFDSYFTGKATPETFDGFAEAPSAPLNIDYENIRLGTWTPATWRVFTRSKSSKAITSWKCTRARTIAFPEGTAMAPSRAWKRSSAA
jgi:hypothetical protein